MSFSQSPVNDRDGTRSDEPAVEPVACLLLAGGAGRRFAEPPASDAGDGHRPKQFLAVKEKPLACYSFERLCAAASIAVIIVVAPPAFHELFQLPAERRSSLSLLFAEPGERRQDSVQNGLSVFLAAGSTLALAVVHDAARPLPPAALLPALIRAATQCGGAAVAAPVTDTIKVCDASGRVVQTPPRERLWAAQTPQCAKVSLLLQGLQRARELGVTLTDDLAALELLGLHPQMVLNKEENIKVTHPADLQRVHTLL